MKTMKLPIFMNTVTDAVITIQMIHAIHFPIYTIVIQEIQLNIITGEMYCLKAQLYQIV